MWIMWFYILIDVSDPRRSEVWWATWGRSRGESMCWLKRVCGLVFWPHLSITFQDFCLTQDRHWIQDYPIVFPWSQVPLRPLPTTGAPRVWLHQTLRNLWHLQWAACRVTLPGLLASWYSASAVPLQSDLILPWTTPLIWLNARE